MLRRFWLLFAQAVTVGLAALFVLAAFRPEWLPYQRPGAHSAQPPASSANPNATGQNPAVSTIGKAEAVGMTVAPSNSQALLSYSSAATRAIPAVVSIIQTRKVTAKLPEGHPMMDDPWLKRFFGDKSPPRPRGDHRRMPGTGSGVIVKSDGLILTNYHVIEGADGLEVVLHDGRKANAKVVGGDPETDLAVIKIDLPDLKAISLGNVDALKIGDVVLAIGNPFGVGQTVTMGIVSATGRNQLNLNTFESFIQTDAAINPGNSGGALVDSNGNLLGINTAIYSNNGGSMGIGFAIPMNIALPVMESIIKNGSVVRGYIGVEPRNLTEEIAKASNAEGRSGVLIRGVVKGGPADKGGIKAGDILIKVGNKAITTVRQMLDTIAGLTPGQAEHVTVLRDGREIEFKLIIGTRPKAEELRRNLEKRRESEDVQEE